MAWGADDWEELSAGEIRSGTITIYDDNDNPIVSERCASSAPKPECGLAPAKRVKTERVQTDRQTTERVQTTSTERVESSSDATHVTTTRVEKSSSSSSYTKTVHPRSVPEPPSPSSPPWSPVDSESDKEEEEEDDDAPDPEQAKELETDLKLIRLAKALGSLPQGEVHYAARVKKPVLVKHNIVDSSATPKRKPASKKSKARK